MRAFVIGVALSVPHPNCALEIAPPDWFATVSVIVVEFVKDAMVVNRFDERGGLGVSVKTTVPVQLDERPHPVPAEFRAQLWGTT